MGIRIPEDRIWKQPFRVSATQFDITLDNVVDDFQVPWRRAADNSARNAHDHRIIGNHHAGRDERARCDEASRTDFGVVEDNRPDSDQRSGADSAAMYDRPVPDSHVVRDLKRHAERRMDHRTILHVDPGPDPDRGDVSSNHNVVHDGYVIAADDITGQICRWSEVASFPEDRLL